MSPNQIALPRMRDRIEFAASLDQLSKCERDREIAKIGDKGLLERGLMVKNLSNTIGIVLLIDKVVELPVEVDSPAKDRYFCTVSYGWLSDAMIEWVDVPRVGRCNHKLNRREGQEL